MSSYKDTESKYTQFAFIVKPKDPKVHKVVVLALTREEAVEKVKKMGFEIVSDAEVIHFKP